MRLTPTVQSNLVAPFVVLLLMRFPSFYRFSLQKLADGFADHSGAFLQNYFCVNFGIFLRFWSFKEEKLHLLLPKLCFENTKRKQFCNIRSTLKIFGQFKFELS